MEHIVFAHCRTEQSTYHLIPYSNHTTLAVEALIELAHKEGKQVSEPDFAHLYQTKQCLGVIANYEQNLIELVFGEVYLKFNITESITIDTILESLVTVINSSYSTFHELIDIYSSNPLTTNDTFMFAIRKYIDARELYEKLLYIKNQPAIPTDYFDNTPF